MSRVRISESALEFEDLTIPLTVRRNRAARRITLRIDVPRRGAVLTLPARAGLSAGLDFVAEKALWLRNAYARLPAAVLSRLSLRHVTKRLRDGYDFRIALSRITTDDLRAKNRKRRGMERAKSKKGWMA